MSSSNLIRLGGLAPIAGGVVVAVYGSLVGLSYETLYGGEVIYSVFLLSMLAGIVALHLLLRRERPRYGLAGAIVSAAAFVGVALILGSFMIPSDVIPSEVGATL